jgi:hypothetical protein
MSNMVIPNTSVFHDSGVDGAGPSIWYGKGAVDGDANPWLTAPVGSQYCYKPSTSVAVWYTKMHAVGVTADWVETPGLIVQRITYSQFTDGTSTSGTKALTRTIPAGAFVRRCFLRNLTGFTGDTSAVIVVGDGSDTDRYMTGTPTVFTTATALDLGEVSGTAIHTTAATVTVTVTSGSDWGAVVAGSMDVVIVYD